MLLGTGIAQEKVDHPLWRAYQEKYNSHHGSIPVLSSTFPKNNALRLYDGQIHTLRGIIKKDPLDLILEEWSAAYDIAIFPQFFRNFPQFSAIFPQFFRNFSQLDSTPPDRSSPPPPLLVLNLEANRRGTILRWVTHHTNRPISGSGKIGSSFQPPVVMASGGQHP